MIGTVSMKDTDWVNYLVPLDDDQTSDSESDKEDIKVEDILDKNVGDLKSYELLFYENILINYVVTYYSQKNMSTKETYNEIVVPILEWLLKTSTFLAKKINQSSVEYDDEETLKRSSYQFCEKGSHCSEFYNKEKITCYHQHYVHSTVAHDIKSLLEYIKRSSDYELMSNTVKDDINKSITTIRYVINHMHIEIEQVENYLSDSETYHRCSNIINTNIRMKKGKLYNKDFSKPKRRTTYLY
jgi:hypothetical protein